VARFSKLCESQTAHSGCGRLIRAGAFKKLLVGCTLLAGGQSGSACKNGFVLPAHQRNDRPTDRQMGESGECWRARSAGVNNASKWGVASAPSLSCCSFNAFVEK
jgi:hypothetical protein